MNMLKVNFNSFILFLILLLLASCDHSEGQEKFSNDTNEVSSNYRIFKRHVRPKLDNLEDSLLYLSNLWYNLELYDSLNLPKIDDSLDIEGRLSLVENFYLKLMDNLISQNYFNKGITPEDTLFFFKKAQINFTTFKGRKVKELLDEIERDYLSFEIFKDSQHLNEASVKKIEFSYKSGIFSLVISTDNPVLVELRYGQKQIDMDRLKAVEQFKEQLISNLIVIYKGFAIYPSEIEGRRVWVH